MGFDTRNKNIKKFTEDPKCKIMLCSLKAGGVGLNLTMASKVLILDLYWNNSVERQAFCRCFRIGQRKEVDIVRYVVKDTIDEDLVTRRMEIHSSLWRMKSRKVNQRPSQVFPFDRGVEGYTGTLDCEGDWACWA